MLHARDLWGFPVAQLWEGEDYATLRLEEEIQRRQHGQATTDLQDLPRASFPDINNALFYPFYSADQHSVFFAAFPTQRAFCWATKPT